tara:strand:+ start:633 stop:902 length:270 start_codon:yes stop_codon:yes gene_type:complete
MRYKTTKPEIDKLAKKRGRAGSPPVLRVRAWTERARGSCGNCVPERKCKRKKSENHIRIEPIPGWGIKCRARMVDVMLISVGRIKDITA